MVIYVFQPMRRRIKKMGRKKRNLGLKTSAGIGVHCGKGKDGLVEDNVSRDIDAASWDIKAFKPFVMRAIA